MKQYSLSKKDMAFLIANENVLNGIKLGIQTYVRGEIYQRLSIPLEWFGRYFLEDGILKVYTPEEWKAEIVKSEPKQVEVTEKPVEPTAKPVEPPLTVLK